MSKLHPHESWDLLSACAGDDWAGLERKGIHLVTDVSLTCPIDTAGRVPVGPLPVHPPRRDPPHSCRQWRSRPSGALQARRRELLDQFRSIKQVKREWRLSLGKRTSIVLANTAGEYIDEINWNAAHGLASVDESLPRIHTTGRAFAWAAIYVGCWRRRLETRGSGGAADLGSTALSGVVQLRAA